METNVSKSATLLIYLIPFNLFTVVVDVSKLFLKLAKIAVDIAY